MTYLIPFILFFVSAHEEMGNLECQNKSLTLKISKEEKGYKVSMNKPKTEFTFDHFEVNDENINNQIFDVYSVKKKGLDLIVHRPETKGAVKMHRANLNGHRFKNCKLLK